MADEVPLSRRDVHRRSCSSTVGGEAFELFHDRGETDDATWVWSPARRILFAGDMFIWASPNCGNPQKVQRYARDWAAAFRKMDALEPEILLPGHGLPIVGAARVHQALSEGAELLETLVEQTLALMNEGARLDDIVHTVRAPEHLLAAAVPPADLRRARVRRAQHLAPVRRLVRRRSVAPQARARRRCSRPSSRRSPAARAGSPSGRCEVAAAGDLRLAGHLAELAAQAAPDDKGVHAARAEVFGGPGARRGVDDVEGHLLVGRARVAQSAGRDRP